MKKLLSLILSLVLILSAFAVLPLAASAEGSDEAEPLSYPRITVTTAGGNGPDLQKADDYVDATITITGTDGSELSGDVLFKVRGNSTALASITKKSFTFKFDKKQDVLGMGKGKKWALLANAFDSTLMRNYIAFELAREMGLEFTSEQRYVELWLDGSYRGCYQLIEPIQEGKDRVNIDIESNNGLNDFMIEREATRYEADVTYITTSGIRFAISEPEEPTAEQKTYVQNTMDSIMTAIKSGDRAAIEAKIDVPSFTRFYLLNELYKTIDFDFSSVFFYYKNGKLYAGPVWDYDLAAGNADKNATEVCADAARTDGLFAGERHLYQYLCSYPWFVEEIRKTYREYYGYIDNISAEGGFIDELLDNYSELYTKNFTDAGWSVSRKWVNIQMAPYRTYDENLSYLRSWLHDRNEWLSEYYEIFKNSYILGDADGDGEINILDATKIQRLLAGLAEDPDGLIAMRGAVNDEPLNILHATMIQRYLAGFTVEDPIGTIIYND